MSVTCFGRRCSLSRCAKRSYSLQIRDGPWKHDSSAPTTPRRTRGGHRPSAFAAIGPTATGMGIHEALTAPRSLWQTANAERVIGSTRRECLDRVIVVNEIGLSRILTQ